MTDEPGPDESKGGADLARFLEDWTTLWREELQAQADDPAGVKPGIFAGISKRGVPSEMLAAAEIWRAAMLAFTGMLGVSPSSSPASSSQVQPRDRTTRQGTAAPGAEAAAAASDARDAEIERLTRRVNELEARLAKLESTRRRRG